jgi:hypothetical protein
MPHNLALTKLKLEALHRKRLLGGKSETPDATPTPPSSPEPLMPPLSPEAWEEMKKKIAALKKAHVLPPGIGGKIISTKSKSAAPKRYIRRPPTDPQGTAIYGPDKTGTAYAMRSELGLGRRARKGALL